MTAIKYYLRWYETCMWTSLVAPVGSDRREWEMSGTAGAGLLQ